MFRTATAEVIRTFLADPKAHNWALIFAYAIATNMLARGKFDEPEWLRECGLPRGEDG